MVNYQDIKDEVEEVYGLYLNGLSENPDGSFAYIIDDGNMYDEFFKDYWEEKIYNHSHYTCQSKRSFALVVYFLYIFLSRGHYTGMFIINCYYRSKDHFACKELAKEMAFIEKCYEENFDKFYGEDAPVYCPKGYSSSN